MGRSSSFVIRTHNNQQYVSSSIMADSSSADDATGQNDAIIQDDDDRWQSESASAMPVVQEEADAGIDETDTSPHPPSSPKSNNGDGNNHPSSPNNYNRDDGDGDGANNTPIMSSSSPRSKKQKQRDKLQRRVPGSLDLDYITPRIIGMAPPRAKFSGGVDSVDNTTNDAAAIKQQSNRQRRQKGNDPGELSTFLEKRHARRYLLFNVADEDADDRSLLLLGRQVVHLPWGSPKIPHPNDGSNNHNNNNSNSATPGELSPMRDSPYSLFRKDSTDSAGGGNGGSGKSPSSGTPAISRVMDICYALHAYLSIPPQDLPVEVHQQQQQHEEQTSCLQFVEPTLKKKRNGKHHAANITHKKQPSTVACIYCGNGKTRTGVIVACYLRFCNEVPDALSGFDLFCHRRGIKSSSSSSVDDISSHIPPSLRQFFSNFDELVRKKQYPYPEPLMLQSIQLQGVPVDDMPCVDIFEYGDVMKQQIYSSHDDTSLNEWDDEEGTYKIGQLLNQDFTLVCRFGGEFAGDDQDPSKVLFRYVNSPKFLSEGNFDLGMVNVDMMRRYADSFDEEDFLLTLVFEVVDDEDNNGVVYSSRRKKKLIFGASKFDGHVLEGIDLILEGWRVLSDAHLSRFSAETEGELMMDSSYVLNVLGNEIDFRPVALQLTNGDVGLARAELLGGMFGFLFNLDLQQPNLLDDETEHSRSDQKSYLSSELSVVSNSATSQTDQSTSYQHDGEFHADESSNLTTDDAKKSEPMNELVEAEEVGQQTSKDSNIESTSCDTPTVVDNSNDTVEQVAADSNVVFTDQTKSARLVHGNVLLGGTADGAKTSDELEKDSQSNKGTIAEADNDRDDDLLCVMRCCGGVGVAVVGPEATKKTVATTKSEGASVADSISVHGDQVSYNTVIDQKSTQSKAGSDDKAHSRQPSSIQCLADSLTDSIDSQTDEQIMIPTYPDGDKCDQQAVISEDYLKYCRMLKMVSWPCRIHRVQYN